MEITFKDNKLENTLTNPRRLKKAYGSHWKSIRNRLSELKAADSLDQIPNVPPPRRHKLVGDYKNRWGIDYSKNCRIVIEPVGDYDIEDLSTIKEVKIVYVGNYH